MSSVANRARIARKRAQRLGFTFIQRGTVFTLIDQDEITMAVGPAGHSRRIPDHAGWAQEKRPEAQHVRPPRDGART